MSIKQNRWVFGLFSLILSAVLAGCSATSTPASSSAPAGRPTASSHSDAASSEGSGTNLRSTLPSVVDPASAEAEEIGSAEDSEDTEKSKESMPSSVQAPEESRYLDLPLDELIADYGKPVSAEYAPSCLGDGEDGELIYDGFTVYTYREGENEVIRGIR